MVLDLEQIWNIVFLADKKREKEPLLASTVLSLPHKGPRKDTLQEDDKTFFSPMQVNV
jgi:hypothetical protein